METKQINKTYSFEEICPDWSQILADNGGFIACKNETFESKQGEKRSVMDSSCCLVGEAHG